VAERSVGYCGADLKAVVAEAALAAFKRRYPQVIVTALMNGGGVNEADDCVMKSSFSST